MPESDLDHEEWWRGAQRFLQPVWLADIRAQVQGLITGPGDHLVADRLAGSLPAGIDVPYAQVTGAPTSLPPSGAAGGVLAGTYPSPGFAASPTFTGTVTAPDFATSGLTGSVAASRYVGATASGAPASGPHLVGDFVIAQNGHVFICTVAGTPGTWADAGGGAGVTYGTPSLTFGTANANGATDEAIRRDATILAFDATVPVTQAFSDAAATGAATVAARRDHKHGMPAGSSTGLVSRILDYAAATDIASATAITANTWTDLGTNQSFTVANAGSLVLIAVRGNCVGPGAGAASEIASRIVLDSAGTPVNIRLGGDWCAGGTNGNFLGGADVIMVTGLSAAVHTVKAQIRSDHTGTYYCRGSSAPELEGLWMQVLELHA